VDRFFVLQQFDWKKKRWQANLPDHELKYQSADRSARFKPWGELLVLVVPIRLATTCNNSALRKGLAI
jgi:hypothetical protein